MTTEKYFDADSRLIVLLDSNGGNTQWTYDTLDRQTTMTFHDGSTRSYGYDAASDLTSYTDENGSVQSSVFDPIGRKTSTSITLASGVQGTTAQSFQYDGLSRSTFARDSVSSVNADTAFAFDSLGRVMEEDQTYDSDTRYVTHDAWTSLPSTGLTYPNGRQMASGYDLLYRRNSVNETSGGASIAAWQFFGNRTATVVLGNGITTNFMNSAQTHSAVQTGVPNPAWGDNTTDRLGYDGSGRLIAKRFLPSGSTTCLVGFTSAYDPSSNKLFERALHAESRSSLYPSYDSMDRLLEYQRGVLASGGASITTPISLPGTNQEQDYDLDGLGNWSTTTITPEGGTASVQNRTHNRLNELLAFGVSPASTPVLYDHGNNTGSTASRGNGNIADDGTRTYFYDALNRMTAAKRKSDNATIGQYTYDALGRRIQKIVSNGGVTGTVADGTTRYLYAADQCVEELVSGSTTRQFVWGQYIDELIQMKTFVNTGSQPLAAGIYYLLSDLLYRSTALTDSSGNVQEAYDTDACGNTLIYSGPGTNGLWFTDDDMTSDQPACEYIFTGRQYDPEMQIYFYRARYYHSLLGRFTSKDSLLLPSTPNLYQYGGSSPQNRIDPYGFAETGIGGGDYEGVGVSFDVDITRNVKPCCTQGSPSTKTTVDVLINVSYGIGLGGNVDIGGYNLALEWKGPQAFVKGTGECESECGSSDITDCCKVCVEAGIQFANSITVGKGIKAELDIDVNGSIRACYLFGAKCPRSGFAIGFCGHVSVEVIAHFLWFSKHFDLVPPTDGCHALHGSDEMLKTG